MVGTHADALCSLWTDRCTITATLSARNSVTKREAMTDTVLCTDEPCRVSFLSSKAAVSADAVAVVSQSIKLFIRQNLSIPSGSRVSVIRSGVTTEYKSSGESATYSDHQEIELTLAEVRA